MQLASYLVRGRASYGVVHGATVLDVGGSAGSPATLREFIASEGYRELLAVRSWSALAEGMHAQTLELAQVQLLPPIPDAGAIICVGLNYAEHVAETGRKRPQHPSTFFKLNRSLVGHDQALRRPAVSSRFDWEAELGVVIGRYARHVDAASALSHVAGYTCVNDGTIRDWQHERDVTQGKNFLASGSCGPWLVTADEIADPQDLTLLSRLNGVVMQRASTRDMIFSVAHLVAYYSTLTALHPGDVISTGTPSGVGHRRTPPLYMRAGDVIEVEIGGIGILRNTVADE
ncbi:MAG TPA: fumarylacetoacetate hydrolase family protein [Steroidobacteraceae bacterium]|nr:fumarylacetoacetate hydrolase family protein [Steroidobacteraceae bacterium]